MVYSLQNVLQYESFIMCIVFLLNGVFPVIVYKVCIFYNWVNNDLGFYDNSIHAYSENRHLGNVRYGPVGNLLNGHTQFCLETYFAEMDISSL